jgi:hypothetical protein
MRQFGLGILLGISLMACAGFKYRYYGIDPEAGLLLGSKPSEDRSLKECQGDSTQKGKCVVLFVAEFERLRADYINAQERLKKCETNSGLTIKVE